MAFKTFLIASLVSLLWGCSAAEKSVNKRSGSASPSEVAEAAGDAQGDQDSIAVSMEDDSSFEATLLKGEDDADGGDIVVSDEFIDKILAHVDTGEDGYLNRDEFLMVLHRFKRQLSGKHPGGRHHRARKHQGNRPHPKDTAEHFDLLVKCLDEDKDTLLSRDEWLGYMAHHDCFVENLEPLVLSALSDQSPGASRPEKQDASRPRKGVEPIHHLDRLMKKFDRDEDGEISKVELKRVIRLIKNKAKRGHFRHLAQKRRRVGMEVHTGGGKMELRKRGKRGKRDGKRPGKLGKRSRMRPGKRGSGDKATKGAPPKLGRMMGLMDPGRHFDVLLKCVDLNSDSKLGREEWAAIPDHVECLVKGEGVITVPGQAETTSE